MDEKIISSIAKFKAKDFFFNPLSVFVYQIDNNTDFIDLKFISYGNFSFKAQNNIRYSLQKRYKGSYRCQGIKSQEISQPHVQFNRNAEVFEVNNEDIRQQRFNVSKNFWGKITVEIDNPAIGRVQIVCKSISYQTFENVNSEEIKQQIAKINSPEMKDENQNKPSSKNDILKTMVTIAEESVSDIENNYKSASDFGKFEIFMFYMFLGWMFYLESNKIDKSSDIANQKLLKLFEYSLKQGISWKIAEMQELYKFRFKAFQQVLSGIRNSNYPITKQYLPAYVFNAIYYQPLSIEQDLGWVNLQNDNFFDFEKYEELSDFTSVFIKQINKAFNQLRA